ncbi:Signal transduction histidine kinase [Pilibacter termitis]|uniref:Signal transduction histidine-protein kinase ArlS n=1 Tax=Pilibacter termitis TaxID=263852 RepID=A0A1T4P268_9ENTE|nr:HAMP domain-containing histidine kinase [Pilibacter termitis]SJZ85502.1 Signal transduction histidine kinase [Pilibacter termitis]
MEKKQNNLKGPSLTIKWAFASTLFIFIVFTIFAVITYKTSVDLIINKERTKFEETVAEVGTRLSGVEEDLTEIKTVQSLQTDGKETTKMNDDGTFQSDLAQLNSFFGELAQPELSIYVYNMEKEMVFSTKNQPMNLLKKPDGTTSVTTIDNHIGYLLVREVHSKKNGQLIGYVQAFYYLNEFYSIRSQLLITLLVLEVLSLVLSSVLGYFLANYFLQPLGKLRNTMLVIKNDPQSNIEMEKIHTGDELEDLSEIFNEMMEKMRSYIEQQEQFVSDVSHELRTPVAIIEGHLSMLNRWGKNEPEILEEGLSASLQEVNRMKSLVQEMLDLSRAGAMDVSFQEKSTRGREVITQVVNNFKLLYPDFHLELKDELHEGKIVQIYRNHLEQLVIILLENAIKYSVDKKEVVITIGEVDNRFVFSVQDFGEGMESEEVKRIFDRFYRIDKARARTKGGNGLGLSIAKQLIENYKGKIDVTSELGRGTTFTISLPLAINQYETID